MSIIVDDFGNYSWFLEMHRYRGLRNLFASLQEKVIVPAEARAKQT